jgi:hypothetical protein
VWNVSELLLRDNVPDPRREGGPVVASWILTR